MKFTLINYQEEAVRDVLKRLHKARKDWREDRYQSAFSLTAATGAGKTVMAAAALEALFHGDDKFDFTRDPGAVVIWFSDDPSLNEQTRYRLTQAADRIHMSDMVVVEATFQREKLQAGKIYFLNTQKLGKNSLLTRGHDADGTFPEMRPDLRSYTIWDTIKNTIEDPDLTLYLILDEAHRGMGVGAAAQNERSTIVKRLINGHGSVPAIPVVWGISATVDRFNKAMEGAEGRTTLPNVTVNAALVQDSGLLKDVIVLDTPDEVGAFDTVLLKRATTKLKEISAAWDAYTKAEGGQAVTPLMVLQAPDKPDPATVAEWIKTIRETWPDLTAEAFANVFGEHRTEAFGPYSVPYVEPQDVQERKHIRVLIAKSAISTGWDCPRAEVMVSFRAATDRTHITQLLGRMVRSPLARRIPGNEKLNSVDCLLPKFNREAVVAVANALMQGGGWDGDMPLRSVVINAQEMKPNPAVPESVWQRFEALPSQGLPQRTSKPVARLTALAHELSRDKLLPGAGKAAHAAMHAVLDAETVRLAEAIALKRQDVLEVEGAVLIANLQGGGTSFDAFVERADFAVIEDAYRRAARQFSPDVAKTYADLIAARLMVERGIDDDEEALIDAHTDVAALGLLPEVKLDLEKAATALTNDWFEQYRETIRSLPDERREDYRVIRGMSDAPQDVDMARPISRLEATVVREENGTERTVPMFEHHLMCDAEGLYPADLNWPEKRVLAAEAKRESFIGWYRNPPRASQDSLGIAYELDGAWRVVRPDFLFFAQEADGSLAVDIIDPHGSYLADALPKLKGLADYAESHSAEFRRIEAVDEIDGVLKVLDLTDPDVRAAVRTAVSAAAAYKGPAAKAYAI
ncbi:DEAD/DEAH box helicase [Brevundimonas sp.]|uniref:DEAD/DEAH box helicase n=1 Tax=Brevundimonas sp. TaxID=1871086 RepID=UPI002CA48765|nr:DEAD/DEAH box helicase family protein [Brevundimonas sp.]HWQ87071.1 DEAD/DEAH box helicase family protein [Brevundimonas sp.]